MLWFALHHPSNITHIAFLLIKFSEIANFKWMKVKCFAIFLFLNKWSDTINSWRCFLILARMTKWTRLLGTVHQYSQEFWQLFRRVIVSHWYLLTKNDVKKLQSNYLKLQSYFYTSTMVYANCYMKCIHVIWIMVSKAITSTLQRFRVSSQILFFERIPTDIFARVL